MKKKEKKYTAKDIQALTKSEWIQKYMIDKAEIDLLYVLIGSLQEYFGGYSLDEEVVDGFFVNESRQAIIFNRICEVYLNQLEKENDVSLIKMETGHYILKSKQICAILKEQYVQREADFLIHKRFKLPPTNDLFKSAEELYGNRESHYNFKQYAFLMGTLIKNKTENEFCVHFANANHKAQMTIEFLRNYEAFGDDSFSVDYFFRTPHVTKINLSEDCIIWKEIERFEKKLMGMLAR